MLNETNNLVGLAFAELEQAEMDFISGAEGTAEIQASPTLASPFTPYAVEISIGATVSGVSGLVSYTKDCL
ncbi:mersacidin family lantibiotic [Staphylococcus pseudintermedius]|uniref:mersacidin family lantibiotic n=1 Tax=Staphylococcus pseudintermedius TaxID=283734 RepID=UPI001A1FE1F0|nr:type 2 lantibiotic [Staphylococcus pseudintermedius]MBJ8269003.1 type 2 lantibiotic [Staphylococcus pseudintermedius]